VTGPLRERGNDMKAKAGMAILLTGLILSIAPVPVGADSLEGFWEVMAINTEEMLVMRFLPGEVVEVRPRSANEVERSRYRIDEKRQRISLPLMPFPLRYELPDDSTVLFYIDVEDAQALGSILDLENPAEMEFTNPLQEEFYLHLFEGARRLIGEKPVMRATRLLY
jgi:hypothetical protein